MTEQSKTLEYLPFRDESYLDLVTRKDIEKLDRIINRMAKKSKGSSQLKRANFIRSGWLRVKEILSKRLGRNG